jgi:hypothetical protein
MKMREKHYFEIGILPIILIPVIGITIGLTLVFSQPKTDTFSYPKYPKINSMPIADKLAAYNDDDEDTIPDAKKAYFTFSGDTVLILPETDPLKTDDGYSKVLYKNQQGNFKTINLPTSALQEIPADTTGGKSDQ